MNKQGILLIAMSSPALKTQSEHYPARYKSRVPLMVLMQETVTSDLPAFLKQPVLKALEGKVYYVTVNSHGAVTAILPDGEKLGLKPGEFEVMEWHIPVVERITPDDKLL